MWLVIGKKGVTGDKWQVAVEIVLKLQVKIDVK